MNSFCKGKTGSGRQVAKIKVRITFSDKATWRAYAFKGVIQYDAI